jgi:hypothetical protein
MKNYHYCHCLTLSVLTAHLPLPLVPPLMMTFPFSVCLSTPCTNFSSALAENSWKSVIKEVRLKC